MFENTFNKTKSPFFGSYEYFDKLYKDIYNKTKESTIPIASYHTFNIDFKNDILDFINKKYFPKDFKNIIKALINTTNNDNLRLCNLNIKGVKLQKKEFSKLAIFLKQNKTDGLYNVYDNKITYYNKDALGHELLHMSSTVNFKKCCISGFRQGCLYSGLNEAYTELLNRRKFFEEDFTNSSYKMSVSILRMIELLAYDKSMLENAYFHNDPNFVYNTFCTYGTKKEFFTVLKYLDLFCNMIICPDNEILYLMRDIVSRTLDDDKIKQANTITSEYFESIKSKKKYINL